VTRTFKHFSWFLVRNLKSNSLFRTLAVPLSCVYIALLYTKAINSPGVDLVPSDGGPKI